MNNNKTMKIVLPIVIVLALVGMYFVKNKESLKTSSVNETNVSSTEMANSDADGDFSLDIESGLPKLEEYAKAGLPAVIDYGSETCPPCRMMKPEYKKFHEKMVGKAFVKYVDIDDNPDAAKEAPIQVIPTQIFYNADGTPFEPSKELREKYQLQMYNHNVTKKHMFTIHQGFLNEEQLLEIVKEMGVEE